ncbi:MAG: TetR family transcriptional regulator [Acidiferrobacterales bacterium]|nr:TetR family transcriptional regulator [Acidiferrobacterales bacterium]
MSELETLSRAKGAEGNDKPVKMSKRDPSATKEKILQAGISEFGLQGFGGARTEAIAERAGCNIRMLYHYFGGKKALYVSCLDRVYSNLREREFALNLTELQPTQAIVRLVEFLFDHISESPDFVRLSAVENTQRGKFLEALPDLANTETDLVGTLGKVLQSGVSRQEFRADVDALQLYISIMSLSYLHVSHRYTLGITHGQNLENEQWLLDRRTHVTDMILSYVSKKD